MYGNKRGASSGGNSGGSKRSRGGGGGSNRLMVLQEAEFVTQSQGRRSSLNVRTPANFYQVPKFVASALRKELDEIPECIPMQVMVGEISFFNDTEQFKPIAWVMGDQSLGKLNLEDMCTFTGYTKRLKEPQKEIHRTLVLRCNTPDEYIENCVKEGAPDMVKMFQNAMASHHSRVSRLMLDASATGKLSVNDVRSIQRCLKYSARKFDPDARPYESVWVAGLPFDLVDQIAKDRSSSLNEAEFKQAIPRLRACAYDAVRFETGQRTGHMMADNVGVVVNRLRDAGVSFPNRSSLKLHEPTEHENEEGFRKHLRFYPSKRQGASEFDGSVYLGPLAEAEERVAEALRDGDKLEPISGDYTWDKIDGTVLKESGLDEHQKGAVRNILERKISNVTGGAGVGKTHTIANAIHSIESITDPTLKVLFTSVTGRAVKRMQELIGDNAAEEKKSHEQQQPTAAIDEDGDQPLDDDDVVSAQQSRRVFATMFRVLWVVTTATNKRIVRNDASEPSTDDHDMDSVGLGADNQTLLETLRNNPVVLVVDEASMVDTKLFGNFLKALDAISSHVVRLVLVGDVEQLPPIGPGAPFAVAVREPKIHTTRLMKIYRAESTAVIEASRAILRGERPVQDSDGHVTIEMIPDDFEGLPQAMVDAFIANNRPEATQAITPINEDRRVWSSAMQKATATHTFDASQMIKNTEGEQMYVGDRLLCIKNMYKFNLMNGTHLCLVGLKANEGSASVDQVYVSSNPDDAKAPVEAMRKYDQAYEAMAEKLEKERRLKRLTFVQPMPSVLPGTDVVCLEASQARENLRLGYCATVHKMQGSESDHVFVVLCSSRWQSINRQMLYTAVTRAKKTVTVYHTAGANLRTIAQRDPEARRSLLPEMIR